MQPVALSLQIQTGYFLQAREQAIDVVVQHFHSALTPIKKVTQAEEKNEQSYNVIQHAKAEVIGVFLAEEHILKANRLFYQ